MFTDEPRRSVCEHVRQLDLRAFASILTPALLKQAAAEAGVALGRGVLNLPTLVWLALSSALHPTASFCRVLVLTFRLISDAQDLPRAASGKTRRRKTAKSRRRHDPRQPAAQPPSEEAFTQARALMPPAYWQALILLLGRVFEQRHAGLLNYRGFRLLVLDGTTISLPKHKTLAEHFGCAKNQSAAGRPQARMVMLLLAGVRLPWRYELTPRGQGESTVAKRLLELRPADLVLMDRGFFHFALFQQVQQRGAGFAIRRIKGLSRRLRTVRHLGQHDRLVSWKPAARRWRGQSMTLRVIDYQIKGFRRAAIITNVLDPRRISREQFVGVSASGAWLTERDQGLYHRRWQIETAFRELKRVQQMRGGLALRGRTASSIEYEVAGHVLLYLLVRWLMVEAAISAPSAGGRRAAADPLRLSFTTALAEVQRLGHLLPLCSKPLARRLIEQMLRDIAAAVVPQRPGRSYPRTNDGKQRRTGAGHEIHSARLRRSQA